MATGNLTWLSNCTRMAQDTQRYTQHRGVKPEPHRCCFLITPNSRATSVPLVEHYVWRPERNAMLGSGQIQNGKACTPRARCVLFLSRHNCGKKYKSVLEHPCTPRNWQSPTVRPHGTLELHSNFLFIAPCSKMCVFNLRFSGAKGVLLLPQSPKMDVAQHNSSNTNNLIWQSVRLEACWLAAPPTNPFGMGQMDAHHTPHVTLPKKGTRGKEILEGRVIKVTACGVDAGNGYKTEGKGSQRQSRLVISGRSG